MDEHENDARVFAETREYIAEHGWTTGELQSGEGFVCSLGGIVASQGWLDASGTEIENDVWPAIRRLSLKLLRVLGIQADLSATETNVVVSSLTGWNDRLPCNESSQQLVLDTFAKAEKIELAGFDPDEGAQL